MATFAGPTRFKVACPVDIECQWSEEVDITLVESPSSNLKEVTVRLSLPDDEKERMNESVRRHLNEVHNLAFSLEWLK
jgi:hypothetical protein